ncbi:MAG: hypothetical protein ACYTHM_23320 [Planctomycetota bacterium]
MKPSCTDRGVKTVISRRSKFLVLLWVGIVLFGAVGCSTTDGYWSFYITRKKIPEFYTETPTWQMVFITVVCPEVHVAGPVLAVVGDILFLPFAIAHDIWLGANREPPVEGEKPRGGHWLDLPPDEPR